MQVKYAEIAILSQYLASSCAINTATARCYQHGAIRPWQVVKRTASRKRWELADGRRR